MSKFVLIKNGTRIVARADTVAEMRQKALEEIEKSPRAGFEACQVLRKIYATRTPPSYTVVEEDVP